MFCSVAGAPTVEGVAAAAKGVWTDAAAENNARIAASTIDGTDFLIWILFSAEEINRLFDDGEQDGKKADAYEHHARVAVAHAESYQGKNDTGHGYCQQPHISEKHSSSQ
ncbi:MAG: hypothetical protein WA968_07440 [Castellaniella sp.]